MTEESTNKPWQPIETAPKDGARILLYRDGRVICGHWDTDKYAKSPRPFWQHDLRVLFGYRDARATIPTHWMPLPAPPILNEGEKGGGV